MNKFIKNKLLLNNRFLILIILFLNIKVHAFIYEGILTDVSDNPVVSQSVDLKFTIYFDSTKVCKVFEINKTVLTNDQGFFQVPLIGANLANSNTINDVFKMSGLINCNTSPVTTTSANTTSTRILNIAIKDSGGTFNALSGDISIYDIPLALQAQNAETFAGKLVSQFFTKDNIGVCDSTHSFMKYDGTTYSCVNMASSLTTSDVTSVLNKSDILTLLSYSPLDPVSGGTISGTLRLNGNLVLPQSTPTAVGSIWLDGSSIKYISTSGTSTLGVSGSGIQSINSLLANNQSINTSILPTPRPIFITNNVDTSTLVIPMASALPSVEAGLISYNDYDKFTNKLNLTGGTLTNTLTVGAGDLNVTSGNVTVTGYVNSLNVLAGTFSLRTSGTNYLLNLIPSALQSTNYSYTWPASTPNTTNAILSSSTGGVMSWVNYNPTEFNIASGTLSVGTINASKITGGVLSASIISGTLNSANLPASGVIATTYGSVSSIPTISVDSYGRITSATSLALTFGNATSSVKGLVAVGSGMEISNGTIDMIAGSGINLSSGVISVNSSSLTGLVADNITTGTLNSARLPSSGVTATTYGSASSIPTISVDSYGRITSATSLALTFGNATSSVKGLVTVGSGLNINNGTVSLETMTSLTAGTFGSGNSIPQLVVDINGRITSAGTVPLSLIEDDVGSSFFANSVIMSGATVNSPLKTANCLNGQFLTPSVSGYDCVGYSSSITAGSSTLVLRDSSGRITAGTLTAVSLTSNSITTNSISSNSMASGFNLVTSTSGTATFDLSLGNTQKIVLSENVVTSSIINAKVGQVLNLIICENATGAYTFSWPTILKGYITSLDTTANKCNAQSFIYDGTSGYANSPGQTGM